MQPIMNLLNLPSDFVAITRTSDGHFLAQTEGDCGFNHFLGTPSFHPGPGKDRSRKVWQALSFRERKAAVRQARYFNLSLKEMLR